ncbi:Translation elongation factor G [Labilithrix luteola]|uniref:Translation elongation factor G n=1 Tax=Labilithrix luteola TaxID=1391654 RepID=A0A0K1Q928_9BACT|nr:hypothetical protein [Labilithrix luteola]AKV02291.1 Translation elongation factor G [Labilithrix luteola]
MQRDITCLRNIGIITTIDAGKTIARDRIVDLAKAPSGSEGSESVAHGAAPVTMVSWTPRSGPFADESTSIVIVESAPRVIDGAVLVLDAARGASEGAESAFREMRARGIPCLAFVDDVGDERDFQAITESLAAELDVTALPLYLPWNDGPRPQIIDILEQRLVIEREDGRVRDRRAVPRDARDIVARLRRRIVEVCAEVDESILGATSVGLDIGADELARALRKATTARDSRILLVACGSLRARRNVGGLLDSVVTHLPSPAERPPVFGFDPRREVTVARFPREGDAFSAIVVGTTNDASLGALTWLRVHSGTMRAGAPLLALPSEETGRPSRIFLPDLDALEEVEEAGPGSIVCTTGLVGLQPGETLSDARAPVLLTEVGAAKPAVSSSSTRPKLTRIAP